MSRLSKEDYREAVGCLKRYNYNCINIMNIQSDILSLSVAPMDGMPKAPYAVSNSVLNKVIRMEEDKDLQKSIREYKIVIKALSLVNKDCQTLFEELYIKNKYKWDIITDNGLSERTFGRRKSELIKAVDKEIKKMA
jgi:hypothetical protein